MVVLARRSIRIHMRFFLAAAGIVVATRLSSAWEVCTYKEGRSAESQSPNPERHAFLLLLLLLLLLLRRVHGLRRGRRVRGDLLVGESGHVGVSRMRCDAVRAMAMAMPSILR